MDRTGFIRTFYTVSFSNLQKFSNYYGRIIQINKDLNIPKEFLFETKETNMFLPNFSVNINAPTKYFIEFMEYYTSFMPELKYVFADRERINELYENAYKMGVLENEEDAKKYIDFIIETGIKILESSNILER